MVGRENRYSVWGGRRSPPQSRSADWGVPGAADCRTSHFPVGGVDDSYRRGGCVTA